MQLNLFHINTTNQETIEQSFENIAQSLFTRYEIMVNEQYYRLLDIESYYFLEGKFEDPYIHGNVLQQQTGRWYFHESGLDNTFGADNAEKICHISSKN